MSNFFKTLNFIRDHRHKKLPDDLGEYKEPIKDGVAFNALYLGNTLIDYNEHEDSAKVVKRILRMAKLQSRKSRLILFVTPKGIRTINFETKEPHQEFCIYRIASCVAIKCHAFLCDKKKLAIALTKSVVQSFSIANEDYEAEKIKRNCNTENSTTKNILTHVPLSFTTSTEKPPTYINGMIKQKNNLNLENIEITPLNVLPHNSSRLKSIIIPKCHYNGYINHSKFNANTINLNGFEDNFINQKSPQTIDDILC
ncbi:low density lipoprotein receptor adapter protein 1-like isoform X2 [Gordionus sp. m RMFG-2023]|uniref:low density lipoprotein receptor adapter protein 1-like isoform X2 n=1 Tax=Gordionus sp. m RMFG-2023 TaxID=3053472 RepID=UPI0031FD0D4E